MTSFTYTIPNVDPIEISGAALPAVDPQTGHAYPLAGPLPNYTIETELLRKGNMYLGQKFIITITGTTLVDPSKSMLVKGERQAAVAAKVTEIISLTYGDQKNIGPRPGSLVITDRGGINPITFIDAILISVEASPQSEQSQGVQDQNYVFVFESNNFSCKDEQDNPITTLDSLYSPSGDSVSKSLQPDSRYIIDYSEDWSLTPNDERTIKDPFLTKGLEPRQDLIGDLAEESPSNVFKTWTLTHNISATGIPFNSPGDGGDPPSDAIGYGNNAAGFRWAKRFIDARLRAMGNDPLGDYTTVWGEGEGSDGKGNSVRFRKPKTVVSSPNNDPGNLTNQNSGNLPPEDRVYKTGEKSENFKAFNQVNEFQRGITEGTYSVTRTWQIANMFGFNTPARMEVDFTVDGGVADSSVTTIGVNISVEGWTEPNDGDNAAVAIPGSMVGPTSLPQTLGELGLDRKYKHAWNWVNKYVLPLPVPREAPSLPDDFTPPGPEIAIPSTYATDLIYKWALRYYKDVLAQRPIRPQEGNTDITLEDIPAWMKDNFETQLQPIPLSFSRTDNETAGTITISTSFNDETPVFEGAATFNCDVDMSNEDGSQQVIAIKPVIGKITGPVIQDMKVTQERSRTVSISMVMNRFYRYVVPNGHAWIDTYWKPILGKYQAGPYANQDIPVYSTNKTQNWNPITGSYSASIEYTWTDAQPLPFPSDQNGPGADYQPQSNYNAKNPGKIDREKQGPVEQPES